MVGVGNGQRPAAQPALAGSWIGDREVQFRRKRQMRLPAAAESESRLGVEKRGALDCSGRRGFPEKIRDHESQRLRAIPGEFPPLGPERSTLRPLDQPTVFLEGQIPLREGGCREEEAGAAKQETPSRPLGPGHPARLPHRQLDHSHPVPGGCALAACGETQAAVGGSSGDASRLNHSASLRSALRFGRNTLPFSRWGYSSLTRLVSRTPTGRTGPHRSRRSPGFHHRLLAGAQLEEQTRAATPRPTYPRRVSRTASVRGVSSRGQFAGSVRGVSSRESCRESRRSRESGRCRTWSRSVRRPPSRRRCPSRLR